MEEVTAHPSRTIASYLPSEVEVRPSITATFSNRPIHKPSSLTSVMSLIWWRIEGDGICGRSDLDLEIPGHHTSILVKTNLNILLHTH